MLHIQINKSGDHRGIGKKKNLDGLKLCQKKYSISIYNQLN